MQIFNAQFIRVQSNRLDKRIQEMYLPSLPYLCDLQRSIPKAKYIA
ncbi:hypothetical protein T08_15072, partial [Trichinella sp. T8]